LAPGSTCPPLGGLEAFLRLATCAERQTIFDEADIMFCLIWMCVIYEALGDISRVKCWSIPGVVALDGG